MGKGGPNWDPASSGTLSLFYHLAPQNKPKGKLFSLWHLFNANSFEMGFQTYFGESGKSLE